VHVTFTGGEALLRPYTLDLVRHALDLGLLVEILTHGYWTDQSRIEQLAEADPWRITVSLDGIGAMHSLVRGRDDFFDKTERSLETLQRVRRERGSRFKIRLKTVVMRQNLADVCNVALYAASKPGVDVFYQPIEQNYNSPEDPYWFAQSSNWPDHIEHAVQVVRRLVSLKREGLPIANSFAQLEAMEPYFRRPRDLRLMVQNHSAHEQRMLCSATTNLEIRPNGDVWTCARKVSIGNIRERGIREIWEQRPQWWNAGCCMQNGATVLAGSEAKKTDE
jgi:MoaA/NifB/PqqE/SkfB family radical SAM enzyme